MEDYLGRIHGKRSELVHEFEQNGIEERHYAIDKEQRSLYSNSELAALAAKDAMLRAGVAADTNDRFLVRRITGAIFRCRDLPATSKPNLGYLL